MLSTKFPAAWAGEWRDARGRKLMISQNGEHYTVSVIDSSNEYFAIDSTGFNERDMSTKDLPATWCLDTENQWHLQAEAGIPGIGPTYRLYFVVSDASGDQRLASEN